MAAILRQRFFEPDQQAFADERIGPIGLEGEELVDGLTATDDQLTPFLRRELMVAKGLLAALECGEEPVKSWCISCNQFPVLALFIKVIARFLSSSASLISCCCLAGSFSRFACMRSRMFL